MASQQSSKPLLSNDTCTFNNKELINIQQPDCIDINKYKLWTTEDVIRWIYSFNKLSPDRTTLEKSLLYLGVNGYNIIKYKKTEIKDQWKIKNMGRRKFVYKK
eukprot:271378_1